MLPSVLLRFFPEAFRSRFGEDVADHWRDALRDARRRSRFAVAACWLRIVGDAIAHGLAERSREWPPLHPGVLLMRLLDDLRAAAKALRRRPAFTLLAGAMLAAGIGFNTALFAVVHAVVLTPLPYRQPDRVVMLWTGRNPDGTGAVNSYADYAEWKQRTRTIETLAIFNFALGTLTDPGDPEEIDGAVVSPEFFPLLGMKVEVGRGLLPGDEKIAPEAGRPVVISHGLWQRRFGGDPHILTRTMTLAGRHRPIVGVVAADFRQPEPFWDGATEFWSPLTVTDEMRTNHAFHYLRVIGRLAPGATVAQAQSEMDGIGRQMMSQYSTTNKYSVIVSPIAHELIGDTGPLLWVFLGALSLVLLLAVTNIVNLLLAKTSGRRVELAVRTALGASRARLASQLLAEALWLGLVGGALGLLFARIGITLLLRYGHSTAAGIERTSIDTSVAIFAVALSVLTGLLCGVIPALRVSRARLSSSLSDARGSRGLEASRARRWLVAAEMALAVPLLVGAGLLTQTLVRMQHVDPGFDAAHALQFRVTLAGQRYANENTRQIFFDQLVDDLRARAGVVDAGIVSSLPLGGLNNTGGSIVFEKADGTLGQTGVGTRVASGGYFRALGIPLHQGHVFTRDAADTHTVVVNEAAAKELWGDADPIGRRLREGLVDDAKPNDWLTVIGVVGDVRHELITRPPNTEIFLPYRGSWSTMTVVARTTGNPESLAAPARSIVRNLDASLPLVGLAPASEFVDGQFAQPRFGVLCGSIFGLLALVLAASGTFAVLSLLVSQRTREIGIRMALGATPRGVGRLMLVQAMTPALIGCGVGALAAIWLTRGLANQVFGVGVHDPLTFIVAIGALVSIAATASWWPTRRAMRVDPVIALRTD